MIVDLGRFAASLKRTAKSGTWNGRGLTPYFQRCRWQPSIAPEEIASIVFTRDVGYHTSGWWKNPLYERCWHLSLAFFYPDGTPAPRNMKFTRDLVRALYGDDRDKVWCEPPYSPEGKEVGVWHYRLFCDEHWQPILPTGEVYGKELTEAGWKSYSDVRAEWDAMRQLQEEMRE